MKPGWGRFATVVLLALAGSARAEEPPRVATDDFPVRSTGRLALDAGLLMSRALTLQAGMATGVGAGLTYGRGRLALGARASWSTATESSLFWTVTDDDYRLRAVAALRQPLGRGAFALRLGAGATIVHEDRVRNQGARANLQGAALETTATAALPAADVELVATIHVLGPWLFVASGGPSALVEDGALRWGWTATLGAGWQP